MGSYSAVVTTGVYCRPGCPARPNPANVVGYELAAAAEAAGFRACLRCRPYRSSEPTVVAGPELVCRAVQLVIDGALDRGTEADLGRRLGVSGRHLRRLFHHHLGTTPDRLARSRRAHFARRLLDDSDLSVTEVAFAAGFGSVRQLNRACRDVFRATPGELRARRRSSDRLVADGGLALRLPFRPPLDWDEMLGYLALRAIPGVEAVAHGTYRRVVVVDGEPGAIEVSCAAPAHAAQKRATGDHLLLRVHLRRWDGLIHLAQRVRRIFGLDADGEAARAHLVGDHLLGPLVRERPGLRVPGTWDAFETGVRAIVGQQVTVAGAGTIAGRLVERHGTPVPGLSALGLTHAFPSPAALADSDPDGLGMPGARVRAVRSFAEAVAADRVRLDRSVELDELVGSITALPGLGPWTAHYVALRLGEPDAFPASDLGLRRGLATGTATPAHGLPSAESLTARAEGWRPWRALAAVHLWTGAVAPARAA
jgi:AraC family transcriptional regulator of adaptative response / DNA-3-methyladenine glycosylase II